MNNEPVQASLVERGVLITTLHNSLSGRLDPSLPQPQTQTKLETVFFSLSEVYEMYNFISEKGAHFMQVNLIECPFPLRLCYGALTQPVFSQPRYPEGNLRKGRKKERRKPSTHKSALDRCPPSSVQVSKRHL